MASLVLLPVLGVTAWLALGRDAQPASPIEDPVVNVPADEPTGDPVATAQSEPADQPAEGVEDPPPPSQPEGRPAPRVQPRVTSLALTPADPTVIRGGEVQLTPAVRDQNGALMSGRPASWRSSATNVATVSGDGLVRGLAPGRAEVTASVDGVSATVLVTVTTVPVASVVVSPSALALDVGASSTLRVEVFGADGNALEGRAVNWSVQGSAARVSDGGRVEALEAGRATVTARADAYSSSSTITVTAPEPPARDEPARDEPAPPDPSVDRREVLGVLDRYRNAIEAEDLDALRAVYPGLTSQQESAWSAFFANADDIRMEIDPGTPRIDGDRATVRVGGVQRFRAGGEQEQPLTFTATLERTGRGWQLVRVQ